MAKGSESKSIITKKILETFDGAFLNDKEIRIPIEENGEIIQIKCTLTAAKVNVEAGSAAAVPSVKSVPTGAAAEITEEEKKEVLDVIERFNL